MVSSHPDGSGRVVVAGGVAANALAWSGGGARIAFSASESAKAGDLPQLWIGTPTGGRPFKATGPTAAGRRTTGVTWLDGVTLVVSYTTRTGPSRLALVTLTRPAATTVPFVPSDPSASVPTTQLLDPAAAPGGALLAYRQRVPAAAGTSVDSIWVAGPRGGKARKLAEAATLGRPVWSADGRTVYVTRVGAGTSDVLAYPAAGGAPVVLQRGVTGAPVLLRRPLAAGSARASRVTGRDGIATSIASSRTLWHALPLRKGARGARAAVLAGVADPLDAALATPLAVAKKGPLLLTGRTLDVRVATELRRAVPARSTVYLVGSARTLPAGIVTALGRLHYRVVRYAGADATATSVLVATRGLGSPRIVLYAGSWQDALVAGPAAANVAGAVLVTRGATVTAPVAAYVRRYHPAGYAVGGLAARAEPSATPLTGRTPGRHLGRRGAGAVPAGGDGGARDPRRRAGRGRRRGGRRDPRPAAAPGGAARAAGIRGGLPRPGERVARRRDPVRPSGAAPRVLSLAARLAAGRAARDRPAELVSSMRRYPPLPPGPPGVATDAAVSTGVRPGRRAPARAAGAR